MHLTLPHARKSPLRNYLIYAFTIGVEVSRISTSLQRFITMACPRCSGLKRIECNQCMGTGERSFGRCFQCKGSGTVPCPVCVPKEVVQKKVQPSRTRTLTRRRGTRIQPVTDRKKFWIGIGIIFAISVSLTLLGELTSPPAPEAEAERNELVE